MTSQQGNPGGGDARQQSTRTLYEAGEGERAKGDITMERAVNGKGSGGGLVLCT